MAKAGNERRGRAKVESRSNGSAPVKAGIERRGRVAELGLVDGVHPVEDVVNTALGKAGALGRCPETLSRS